MPYPSQISLQQVIDTAGTLLERDGFERFSLAGVAAELGVKTPSLYRYVDSRVDLLRKVNLAFLNQLFDVMALAGREAVAPRERLLAVLNAYRAYARAHPRTYLMSFAYSVSELRPDEDLLVRMVLPLQEAMAALSGAARSLPALRGALALVHGWVMLELTDQLRRGGDLDADFQQAARAYLDGWADGG